MTNIVSISAGTGEPSTTLMLSDRIGESLRNKAVSAHVSTVALREVAHEIVDANLTGFAAPKLQHIFDQLSQADALIVVSPVYQGSFSGLFKSFFDGIDKDLLIGKPVLLAATGGTARHSLAIDYALRPLFSYLQAFVMPTGVFAAPHDWGSEGSDALDRRIDRATSELASVLSGAGTGRSFDDEIDLLSDTMLSISQGAGSSPGNA